MIPIQAKRLAVGDRFIPDVKLRSSLEEGGWFWTVREHVLTGRGDYSTIVECDGSDWTERFDPDERVWVQ